MPPLTGRIGPRGVRGRHRPHLTGGRAVERRGGVDVHRPYQVGPVLVHVVPTGEEALEHFPLGSDRDHLAARVCQLVGIVRQQVEIQAVGGELRLVKRAPARPDGDVARRQLRRRQRPRVERQRQAGARQAGREAELARNGGVRGQAVQPADQGIADEVRLELRVVNAVAAADGEPRTAGRAPGEAHARREVLGGVQQGLAVVAQPEIQRQLLPHPDAVLHETGVKPLAQLVAADSVVDRLRVLLHVVQGQLVERRSGGALEGEGAEDGGAELERRCRPRWRVQCSPPRGGNAGRASRRACPRTAPGGCRSWTGATGRW